MCVHLNLIYLLSQSNAQFNNFYVVVIDYTHVYTHVYYLSDNSQLLHYLIKKFIISSRNLGASINARMNNGWTPLHCAVEAGQKKITQLLLDSGSHPLASDRFNDTPFDIARIYKRDEILQILDK